MLFGAPDARTLQTCDGVLVYDAQAGGEHKLGSDSTRRWVAAQKDDILIIERTSGNPEGDTRTTVHGGDVQQHRTRLRGNRT